MITVCFTGHRPSKLGGYDYNNEKNMKIKNTLKDLIRNLLKSNPDEEFVFYCGGALGVDTFAFDSVCAVRGEEWFLRPENKIRKISIVLAIPFKKYAILWPKKDQYKLETEIRHADQVVYVDEINEYYDKITPIGEYSPFKMQARNQYMVDHSKVVIGVWDGSKGGTKNCLDYAKKKKRKILIINPNNIK